MTACLDILIFDYRGFGLSDGESSEAGLYADGKVVFENAPEPKTLVLVKRAVHNNVPQTLGVESYNAAIADWINFSVGTLQTTPGR